ncbi:MAG: hypothetical protein PHC60_02185 [Heliobacteriaceae bacterium]|nr:hypothetical protein [Heliobacteriaceae bacterium]
MRAGLTGRHAGGALLHVCFLIAFFSLITAVVLTLSLNSQVAVRTDQQVKQLALAADAGLEAVYAAVQHYAAVNGDPLWLDIDQLQELLTLMPGLCEEVAVSVTLSPNPGQPAFIVVTVVTTAGEARQMVQVDLCRERPTGGWSTAGLINRREF